VRFQTKKITKKSDGRKNTKESFAKMYEDRKMENPIRGKTVQGYDKESKKTMEKRRSRKT
jgi:hypothetical protein